jgi:TonB family protein
MFRSSIQLKFSLTVSLGLTLALSLPAASLAQESEPGDAGTIASADAAPPPKAAPPTLLYAPEPAFPETAKAAGQTEATVTLRVVIDVQGQVSEAEVVEPQGFGFDEAARQAAFQHRFEPARLDDQAIAARVLLRVEFRAPPEPPAAQPEVAAAPAPAPAATPSPAPGVDVTVRGHSQAERMRRSAEAVHVVELEDAKRRTADLGEVLARTQGVGVQRAGGLGSDTRFSLNGLTDDQIRFFVDEIPLDFAGYPFGIANIPINLIERVEIFRGVVLRSEEPRPNAGAFVPQERETHRFGIGDALRYTFAPWIYAKASYEWATRLPRPDEIFGNAFPIQPNLGLKPEISHNLNLGVTVDARTRTGRWRGDVNGFMRDADQLIVLVGNDKTALYQNVYSARSLGAELAAGWTSPGDYLALDGNVTYVDFRNTSDTGPLGLQDPR